MPDTVLKILAYLHLIGSSQEACEVVRLLPSVPSFYKGVEREDLPQVTKSVDERARIPKPIQSDAKTGCEHYIALG